jgi:hypothetical protein
MRFFTTSIVTTTDRSINDQAAAYLSDGSMAIFDERYESLKKFMNKNKILKRCKAYNLANKEDNVTARESLNNATLELKAMLKPFCEIMCDTKIDNDDGLIKKIDIEVAKEKPDEMLLFSYYENLKIQIDAAVIEKKRNIKINNINRFKNIPTHTEEKRSPCIIV